MPSIPFVLIEELCDHHNDTRCESELLERLSLALAAHPDVAHETDLHGSTLLHEAARARSPDFCKLLIEQNPEAVKTVDGGGFLPFHQSCVTNNIETIKYLFQLYPECIHVAEEESGEYPIHSLLRFSDSRANISEVTRFLLKHDRGAVTKPDCDSSLPLHIAIDMTRGTDIVKQLFDAYPEAIYIKRFGETPMQQARRQQRPGFDELISYFEYQLECVRQSEGDTKPDRNGQLLIHRGLHRRDLPLGTIKLMVKANPASISAVDNWGNTPLHIAFNYRDNDIVKYLIKADVNSLRNSDMRGNFLLHHACLAGNVEIVNFILENTSHGASVRNSDGKLPIQLLLYDAECNRDSIECVGAIHCLLLAYPDVRDIAL